VEVAFQNSSPAQVAAPGRAAEGVEQLVSLDGRATVCIQSFRLIRSRPTGKNNSSPSPSGESKHGIEWNQAFRLIWYQRRDLQNVPVVGNGWTVNSRETGEALLCVKVV
jgi:hypothetical protein